MKIANGHQAVMPYIMVKTATAFIDFTSKVFNAELKFKKMRDDEALVMHAEIMIGGSTIMFCDATDKWSAAGANLFVYVDNADESYRKALAAGAESVTEPATQDYGRSCGIKDPCGNVWWITSVE